MEKKEKKTLLKDIADKVGVSTALVSYTLNNLEKEKRVGAEIAKRIREVARELNYTPNQIAQSLRKGSTKTIGLIVADIANPFFGSMARFIENEATSMGYNLIIGSTDEDSVKSAALVETLINRQVDGFIIVPSDNCENQIKNLVQNKVPLVLVDRNIPGITASFVMLDNYKASFDAVSHLIQSGRKRIGMIAYKSSMTHMDERIRGYSEAMEMNGLKNNILVREVRHINIENDVQNAMDEMISPKNKIDAVLLATNQLSLKGLYFLMKNNIKIPEELGVVGFDENEAFDFFYAPLTYIKQPINEMARESVRILVDQINGIKNVSHIRLIPQLIKRKSS
jgi:LacI family transcriptional regulator, galactose operon repressor